MSTYVEIAVRDADEASTEELVRNLRRELHDIGMETASAPCLADLTGARGMGELPAAFLLKVVPELIGRTARAMGEWLKRSGRHTVELTIGGDSIKLSRATPDQQDRLIALLEAKTAIAIANAEAHALPVGSRHEPSSKHR